MAEGVELGFAEKVEDASLLMSPYFPSKIGGRPAWLELSGLLPPEKLACFVCGKPSVLLLQIYAPQPERTHAFHRSVFVFMCKDPRCHQQTEPKAFKVLRSQLPKVNVFYPSDPLGCTNVSDKKGEEKEGMQLKNDLGIACSGTGGEEWTNDQSEFEVSGFIDTLPLNVLASTDESQPQFRSANKGTEHITPNRETVTASSKMMPPSGEHSPKLLQQGTDKDTHESTDQLGLVVKGEITNSNSSNTTGEVTNKGLVKSCDGYTCDVATSQKSKTLSPAANFARLPPLLCAVCGCLGPKKCGRCKQVSYCSREHQIHDWKSGHKLFCSELASGKCVSSDQEYVPGSGVLLPEFEIVTEVEPEAPIRVEERSEEERMEDYFRFLNSGRYSGAGEDRNGREEKVLEKAASDACSDKFFKTFRKRVALEPEQVIRYQRGGEPLLVSGTNVPRDVPNCTCGAKRVFEFQIMPQLLYYLKLDSVSDLSIDWGTLMVFTCAESCVGGYQEEFLWKQNFSEAHMT